MRSSFALKSLFRPDPKKPMRSVSPARSLTVRYLIDGLVIAAPTLICMALIVLLLRSETPMPAVSAPWQPAIAPAAHGPDRAASTAPAIIVPAARVAVSMPAAADPAPQAAMLARDLPIGESLEEQAFVLEQLVVSQEQSLGARGEALADLTRIDSWSAHRAFDRMIASELVDERLLAVSLLNDWRSRTGDPDGRITGLLRQAGRDADAGVAYQARIALDPPEREFPEDY